MNAQIVITGWREDAECDHCGRALRGGIEISDGRVLGADCLISLTKPKKYHRSYRSMDATGVRHIARSISLGGAIPRSSTVFELLENGDQ